MSFLRPYLPQLTNDSFYSKVGESINNNTINHGAGLRTTKNGNGSFIELIKDKISSQFKYKGNYDFTAQYFPNDVVMVDPNLTYTDTTGSILSVNVGGSSTSSLASGLFICSNYVPPAFQDYNYLITYILPAFQAAGGTVTDDMSDHYRHYQYNKYYPTYPTQNGTGRVSENTWTTVRNQNYWIPLNLSTVGGGISFQGEWNPTVTYRTGSLVVVSPDSNAALLGYPEYALILGLSGSVNASGSFTGSFNSGLKCTQSSMPGYYLSTLSVSPINMSGSYSGSNSSSFSFHCPQIPYTSYWMMIQPYPVQEYKMEGFGLKDYFSASIVTSSGNISNPVIPLIPVAKCTQTRMISFESSSVTGYNFNYWYSYPTGSISASVYVDGYVFDHGVWESSSLHTCSCENIRYCYTGSLSGSLAETQSCYPRYLSGNIIDGYIPYNGTGVWWTSSNGCIFPVYIQEMTDRRWVKRYNSK